MKTARRIVQQLEYRRLHAINPVRILDNDSTEVVGRFVTRHVPDGAALSF
jgi:hypothetical protein